MDSGACGDSLTWSLDSDGVLTISGTGEMYDYQLYRTPWGTEVYSIVLEEGIVSLGNCAFNGVKCGEITLPESITQIGGQAFNGSSLTCIVIPNSVTSIGEYAFNNCRNLKDVTLSNELMKIDQDTFSYCTSLESISVPEGVTSIGIGAFEQDSELSSAFIPDSVTQIEMGAFSNCPKLVIHGYSGTYAEKYANNNNIPFVAEQRILTHVPAVEPTCTEPGNIEYWTDGKYYFSDKEGTQKISLAATVIKALGHDNSGEHVYENIVGPSESTDGSFDAVRYCVRCGEELSRITYITSGICGDNLTWKFDIEEATLTISGVGEMYDYDSPWRPLEHWNQRIIIEDGVTSIGDYAFATALWDSPLIDVTIPDSVTRIGNYAFKGCASLTNVDIPESVTSIGNGAFAQCYALADADGFVIVKNILFAYSGAGEGEDVDIPSGVTRIDGGTFQLYTLNNVTIPNSVTSIEPSAFFACDINNVKIPDSVTTLGDQVFIYCNIANLTIPASVTSIGLYMYVFPMFYEVRPTIYGYDGTAAEAYADMYGFDFVSLGPPPLDLTFVFAVAPTCTEPGNIEYWTDGEHYYFDAEGQNEISLESTVIPATGHTPADPVKENEVPATCTEPGHYDSVVYCSVCGEELSRSIEEIPALGHDWGAWTVTTPASCTAEGVETRVCANDPTHVETRPIPATGHIPADPVRENEVPATCTEPGHYDSVVYCAVCQAEISRGTEEIPALGHDWGEWTVTTPASCTAEGVETRVCANDPTHVETRAIPATGHIPADLVRENEVPATCTEPGHYDSVVYCSVCGEELAHDTEETPALGHSWGPWEVVIEPTETEDGLRRRICQNDPDHTELEVIPATGSAGNPFVDVEPDAYYYDPVVWAVGSGITNGTDATHFSPSADCTRGQVVTFLWRAHGSPEPTSTVNPFVDVPEDAYYYKAVLWAVEMKITNGTDATHFSPDDTCTRGQVVTFLYRDVRPGEINANNPFLDVPSDAYYTVPVLWAVVACVTNGTDARHFSPDATCTRGQIVAFLYRALA